MFTVRTFKVALMGLFLVISNQSFASPEQVQGKAFYVSPKGLDTNDGLSTQSPFQTLERAQKAAQSSDVKTIYLRGGVYNRRTPVVLTEKDAGQSWLAYPNETPVLDGGKNTAQGFLITSSHITIRWLKIQNYGQCGIKASNSAHLFFDSNTITNIFSDGWNQGGIVLLYGVDDALISHNTVQNSGYSGLMSANTPKDHRGLVRFEYNKLIDTCQSVHDCGALYSDDRTHNSVGVVMKNNIIGNFGRPNTGGRGIYLDDNQSNARVSGNIVYGDGDFPIQIHGGDHNTLQNNIFDISEAGVVGLYQWIDTGNFPNYGMGQNVFTCNIVYSQGGGVSSLWEDRSGGNTLIQASGNLYYSAGGKISASSTYDKSPKFGNPGFVNAEKNNYSFKGEVPKFCNGSQVFQPIDISEIGPVANPLAVK